LQFKFVYNSMHFSVIIWLYCFFFFGFQCDILFTLAKKNKNKRIENNDENLIHIRFKLGFK